MRVMEVREWDVSEKDSEGSARYIRTTGDQRL
jgi:hypothetical protein